MSMDVHIEPFVHNFPMPPGLKKENTAAILSKGNVRRYNEGQYIFHRGDDASALYIVMHGWVKLHTETQDGNEIAEDLAGDGRVFGENAFFPGDRTHAMSAQALKESFIMEISASYLRGAEGNAFITGFLLDYAEKRIKMLRTRNEHLAAMSAAQRLACFLLRLSAVEKVSNGNMVLPFNKNIIAAHLAMKCETFSRALAQLKEPGVSVDNNKVFIGDFAKLSRYACLRCSLQPHECPGNRLPLYAQATFKNVS